MAARTCSTVKASEGDFYAHLLEEPVLGIRDILVRIRIRTSD
jgi:hypothetical protein